jgi:hypothetical protein
MLLALLMAYTFFNDWSGIANSWPVATLVSVMPMKKANSPTLCKSRYIYNLFITTSISNSNPTTKEDCTNALRINLHSIKSLASRLNQRTNDGEASHRIASIPFAYVPCNLSTQ